MNVVLRQLIDKLFSGIAIVSVVLVIGMLAALLLPMTWRGSSAVVFRGTVEFRKMQLEQFNRGNSFNIQAEAEASAKIREQAYEILDRFAAGLDTSELETKAKQIHRTIVAQIASRDLAQPLALQTKRLSAELRDSLLDAFKSHEKSQVLTYLEKVLSQDKNDSAGDSFFRPYFELAREYQNVVTHVDLSRREEYAESLKQIKTSLRNLLGPRSGERTPAVMIEQYGATRWDQASQHLDRLIWNETWAATDGNQSLSKKRVLREEQFAGTELVKLFPFLQNNIEAMMRPQWTFYWQYFIDDSRSGHYFGGVGPEILGTLLVTVLAIALALPAGVIAAAYLVECAGNTFRTRIIRLCVNTLAGVPSIVFGLFGLAFFVIYLLPKLQMREGSSIIAGSLTLALLVLPVVIRVSEEAILSVPRTYKEAALGLGASRFHCFVTVTLPSAMPGILTGLILSMSRAAGETAPILFTAGVAMGPIPTSLSQPTRTLSYSSYDMAVGDKMAMLAPHNQFGMVMTLVGLVLLLNLAAIVLRGRLSKKLRGQ